MAQVQVTIDGKLYRMSCDDGQEEHLTQLAEMLNSKVSAMKLSFGEIGDMRLTVMAAITLADELAETKQRLADRESEIAGIAALRSQMAQDFLAKETEAALVLENLAVRIGRIAKQI